MDGSEASMIPVIIRNAHHILNLKSSRHIESLPEFSVGRGVADLFIFQKDIRNLRQRQKIQLDAFVELNAQIPKDIEQKLLEICFIKRSVAIEAKVRDWRKGIKQAMRYKMFAERSYLAIYNDYISPACNNINIFKLLNIGLIGVSDHKIKIYYQPEINKVNKAKYLLAMERAYSIIDKTQNSFVIRNNFTTNKSLATH